MNKYMQDSHFDIVIIGAGIVGLSTAWQLQQRYPHKRLLVLEKESGLAYHQTGHNSGVIHAGVYYPPDSLKARFCKQGVTATSAFCRQFGIEFEQCGKLLVATNEVEYQRMLTLFARCQGNELEVELLDAEQLHRREPHIVGVGAIWVPATGIVDYRKVARKMAAEFIRLGGELRCNTPVMGLDESASQVSITIPGGAVMCDQLVVCAGLQADRLVDMMKLPRDFAIVPFRGEYYRLPPEKSHQIKHLIYPIPDPEMPFLGVHLTRMIDGSVTVGPNAVLGWKREGYRQWNVSVKDSWDNLRFGGLWHLMCRHWRAGVGEFRDSWSRKGYLKRVQKYYPSAVLADLQPYPAGVRAQAVMRGGSLVQDFLFSESPRSLHVCNAPSPAATSAIPIGEYLADMLSAKIAQLDVKMEAAAEVAQHLP